MDAYSQFLNWHVVAAILSGIFAVAAWVLYFRDILWGSTRPNAVSFSLWTVLQVIALAAQVDSGASWSVVFMIFVTLGTLSITVLALCGYGYRKYGRIDALSLVLAVAAIVGWQVTGNPLLAIWLAIAADFFASVPTVVKTAREPYSEELKAWGLITVAAIFGAISTERLDVANLAMPVYLIGINGLIFSLAYFGRRRLTADH